MSTFAKRRPFDAGFLCGAVLSALAYVWMLVGGFPLAARAGSRQHYYTFAAISLLRGRLDVPSQALGGECFALDGRCYGYFGITPSLLRLPVVLIAGDRSFSNHIEAVFFILAFVTVTIGLWWVARQLVAAWAPSVGGGRLRVLGFAVAGGLAASPLLFLASRPLVYEEAILWGVAFGTIALGAAISVHSRPRPSTTAVLLVANLLGVLARPTVGASGILATLFVGMRLWRSARERRGASGEAGPRSAAWGGCLVLGAIAAFASAPILAYAKFGTFSPPYQYHANIGHIPEVLGPLSHPGGVNAAVLPTKLLSSIRPDSLRILRHSPYVELGESSPTILWPAKPSDVAWETTSGISGALPFTTLAAATGFGAVILALRRRRAARGSTPALEMTVVALLSALGALCIQLLFPGHTYRYIADWLPLLFICGTVGLAVVARRPPSRPWRRAAVMTVGTVLLAGQLLIQVGLAVQNGLEVGGEHPPVCTRDANPYGELGEIFCPRKT